MRYFVHQAMAEKSERQSVASNTVILSPLVAIAEHHVRQIDSTGSLPRLW